MPAVDPTRLKRLMIAELLTPYAIKQRLSAGQLADLVHRATAEKRFELSSSGEFSDYSVDETDAADWADELKRSGSAPHLFASDGSALEPMYGGMKKSDFDALTPEQQLSIVNRLAFEER